MRIHNAATAAVLAVAVAVVASAEATATFPGKNGDIVYSLRLPQSKDAIYSVSANGGKPTKLTDSELADRDPSVSADGQTITYIAKLSPKEEQVMTMPIGGGAPTQVTQLDSMYLGAPAFSSDGKTIVFTAEEANDRSDDDDIWSVDVASGEAEEIYSAKGTQGSPSFAPDDSKIVFDSFGPGNFDIFVMRPNGSGVKNLTTDARGGSNDPGRVGFDSPEFSPDGKRIIASSNFDSRPPAIPDIVSMKPNGSQIRTIIRDGGTDSQPSYSPDGKRIVFVRDITKQHELVTAKVDGTDLQVIAELNLLGNASPSWAPK